MGTFPGQKNEAFRPALLSAPHAALMRGQCADHSIKRTSFARGWIQDLASSSRKASFVPHALPYGNGQPFSSKFFLNQP
jgi:hypothetical protein